MVNIMFISLCIYVWFLFTMAISTCFLWTYTSSWTVIIIKPRLPIYVSLFPAPPDPPSNVHIDLCEPEKKNATIGWQPGRENYAPILNFIIQFNTSFNPDTWYDIATNISQNVRYMRVSLSPYANYSFRVLARNKIGLSNPSIHTSDRCALLKPERPDKNPENVMGEGDTPDNLIIFWTVSYKPDSVIIIW